MVNITIEEIYKNVCDKASDINEHLPTLRKYAEGCDLVVEMGVRWVVSTWAFLAAKPKKLLSIDIVHPNTFGSNLDAVNQICKAENQDFEFIQGDTTRITIPQCDFLFIDTWHVYDQLKIELDRHCDKVNKFIALHDTETFGKVGETPSHKGLQFAVDEFLESKPEWQLEKHYENNNGLTILKRV